MTPKAIKGSRKTNKQTNILNQSDYLWVPLSHSSVSLPAFDFLDLTGVEDKHAVLEVAHLTCGSHPQTRGRRLLVPGGHVDKRLNLSKQFSQTLLLSNHHLESEQRLRTNG